MNSTRLTTTPQSSLARAIKVARRAPWLTEGIQFFRRRQQESRPMSREAIVKAITKGRCHCNGTCATCTLRINDMIGENYPY